jgi:hypothetical protein
MKTCATEKILTGQAVAGNLFLPVPDTGVSTILDNINAVSHTTRELVFNRQIALAAGKPNAKTKFHQQYRQLLARGKKARAALEKQFASLEQDLQLNAFAPSQRIQIKRVVEQLRSDLADAARVIHS